MWKVRELADRVTNVVMNYTEVEAKVREATNDDAWGPTGALMLEIAQATFTFEHFPEVMTMLWKRMLQDNKKNWRRTYKSLLLLNYLVRNGSERVVTSSREHIYDLRGLENYVYVDEFGKDQGINIRHKVKELIDFIQDDDKLREERKKAKKNKDKYVGLSSDAMGLKGIGDRWDGGKWGKEEYDWADSDKRKDEFDNSDEGERYDSEGETPMPRAKEYRDSEKIDEPKSLDDIRKLWYMKNHSKQMPTNSPSPPPQQLLHSSSSSSSSPAKKLSPVKKIDLGAAVNYGKSETTTEAKSKPTIEDVLGDDLFNPRQDQTADNEFGDFTNAFPVSTDSNQVNPLKSLTNPVQTEKDDFADFTSAFSNEQALNKPSLETTHSQPVSLVNGTTFENKAQSNADLLLGLSVSQTLNTSTSPAFGILDSQPQSLPAAMNPLDFSAPPLVKECELKKIGPKWLEGMKACQNLDEAKVFLVDILEFLPGPLTEQKLIGLDVECFDSETISSFYNRVLNIVLNLSGFNENDMVLKLFVCEGGSSSMFSTSMGILLDHFKITPRLCKKSDVILDILFKLVYSEAFVSCLCLQCLKENSTVDLVSWEKLVRVLTNLPEKILNIDSNVATFSKTNFSRILYSHLNKIMDLLFNTGNYTSIDTRPLAVFFSRLIFNFQDDESVEVFIRSMTKSSEEKYDFDVYFSTVLQNVETSSVEKAALAILKFSNNPVKLLSQDLMKLENWNYVICKKIIFYTYHSNDVISSNLIKTLMGFSMLKNILLELTGIWSDKSALIHTSYEQHLYITKLMLLSIKLIKDDIDEDVNFKNSLISNLLRGVPVHLESTVDNVRAIGMITAEIMLSNIKTESEEKLEFDYSGMKPNQDEVIKYLKELDFVTNNVECKKQSFTEIIVKNEKHVEPSSEGSTNDQHIDDEFEPYDVTNDVKLSVYKRPKYLRDLIEGLGETKDHEIFVESLKSAEELIYKQLPNDDVSLAIQLSQILLCLQQNFHCDNFEDMKFKASVAILLVYPQEIAEYLCAQFHAEVGKYSISHKLFVLQVLSTGAIEMSKPKMDATESSEENKLRSRIIGKTRKIASPTVILKGSANRFVKCAGSFFFPLIRGDGGFKVLYRPTQDSHDDTTLLLVSLLKTLSVILVSAVNISIASKMGRELLESTWNLRYHSEPKVREAIISCILAAALILPSDMDYFEDLTEAKMWLVDIANKEVEKSNQVFAAQTAIYIDNKFNLENLI
ncbi:telomere length regulation protein TEL2 homolog isoform X2 [Cimex lectularius]|uniref:ENTH domain-containing protein n=1 Tax=Cimex lectularius TaxID=79782 RepID=A0A8I6TFW6_CIMLE|nr:telomere length regulation protein TEL2 homolog isoform X2 [Cimex lectularius]